MNIDFDENSRAISVEKIYNDLRRNPLTDKEFKAIGIYVESLKKINLLKEISYSHFYDCKRLDYNVVLVKKKNGNRGIEAEIIKKIVLPKTMKYLLYKNKILEYIVTRDKIIKNEF